MSEVTSAPGPKCTTDRDIRIGYRIRTAREAAGVSQTDFGKALGISFQQLQKYERAKSRISAARLQDVADLLGVPVTSFYDVPGKIRALELPLPTVAQAKAALLKASDALADAKAREAAALQAAA